MTPFASAVLAPETPVTEPEPISRNVCDASAGGTENAVARVSKSVGESELYFCAHHLREHAPALLVQGFDVFTTDGSALDAEYFVVDATYRGQAGE